MAKIKIGDDKNNKKLRMGKKQLKKSIDPKKKSKNEINNEGNEESFDDSESQALSDHKKQLEELAKNDPDFYNFLKEQDADLLQFNESSSELEEDESSGKFDEYEKKDGLRTNATGRKIIDQNFVISLQDSLLQDRPEPEKIRQAIAAFIACVAHVGADVESPSYVINDGIVFESVIRLCFMHLGKLLYELLGPIKTKVNEAEKDSKLSWSGRHIKNHFRRWKKYNSVVKSYLHALSLFLNEVQTPDAVVHTVRAVTDLLDLYICYTNLTRSIIKGLIRIWSRRTDECRCVAFIALCKLVRIQKKNFPTVIKWCYLGYVTNVRNVSAESWPLILFMQKSFAEMCMIYPDIAYQYTFVYIRQTAIHLRNAMIAKRKDLIQTIYNWQFMQCLYLWAQVVSRAHRYRVHTNYGVTFGIDELTYPLCQITISTMKLFPSLKYISLRLHCLRILLIIQQSCRVYIPTFALATELLNDARLILKKKPLKGKGTIKSIDVKCSLKATKSHLEDAGFRQAVLEELFKIHLEALHILQKSPAFPDAIIPVIQEIKKFIKNCRNAEFAQLFKSLETKIKEQATYTREILDCATVNLGDRASLDQLEGRLLAADSPLTKFYNSWQNVLKIRENPVKSVDTKSVQPSSFEPEIIENSVNRAETTEVKRNKEKLARQKYEKSASVINKNSQEDILEDLVLSDAES